MKIIVAFFAIIALALAAPQSPDAQAQILRSNADVGPESYNWEFETSNSIKANEAGQLKQVGEQPAITSQGAFEWVSPEGEQIQVSYVADENGYQPQGSHLPTPPPIPEAIQRALEWIAAHPSEEQQ